MRREVERPVWQKVLIALGKALAYLALFLGCQLLVGTIYSSRLTVELMLRNPSMSYDDLYALVYDAYLAKAMEISLISGLLTLAVLALFFKLRRRGLRQELCLHPAPPKVFGWCAGLAFCLYWLVTLALSLLPSGWMEDYLAASEGLYQTGLIPFLATVIVAPVVEEVVFRGLILSRLERAMPGWYAIAVSAVVFGWCHGELVWFCYAFMLGMVFGYITHATGSILPAMVMHLVFNGAGELLGLVEERLPNGVVWVLAFVLGVAGTVFCAIHVRDVLAAVPEPEPTTAPEPPHAAAENVTTEAVSLAEEPPRSPSRPARARWDTDSGPGHKFPPQMR